MTKYITEKFWAFFGMRDEDSVRDTFTGELNYEADRLFYIFFVGLFVWIPYMRYDFELHQFPVFAFSIRTLFSVVSAVLILLKLTKYFKKRPDILFTVMVASLYFLPAVVAATAGGHAAAYMGGMSYVWVLPAFAPLSLKIKYPLQIMGFCAFFLMGALAGLDFQAYPVLYSASDLLMVFIITFFLSYMMNTLRYKSWKQRVTISDLADQAEAAVRAKSEYLNTLSHEVRTPLTVISTYTQLAVRQFRQGKIDEQTVDGLDAVYEAAMRVAELAANTLSPRESEERVADLAEIALQLVRLYAPAAKSAGRAINVNLAAQLLTVCNVGEITQVIWNLLDNALKHGGHGEISVDGNESAGYVYVIITDYGAGIPPDMLPKIFERGVSGAGGSGLGLAIANEIVQKHGGRLMIESEHGLGTTATLLLKAEKRAGAV